MADVQRKLVHKQFNSPMGLYSQQNVAETLNRELKAFGNQGIEIDEQIAKPLNLANSAVLRAVEEEEEMKCGYKRVAWPPASEERIVREFTPQPQTQYQPVPAYNQQQQPPSAASAAPAQAPIYNNVSHQAPTNNNNMARDCNSPYKPNLNPNPNQIQYEAFPPQTPETPIILKDKQFSRQASQEPNQMNTLPYYQQQQQQQQQYHHQQQPYQYQQPQNQPIQQYGQQQYGQQQQHYQHHQEPYYQQQQQQQPIHYPSNQQEQTPQQQKQQQQLEQHAPSGWKPIRPPQTKPEHLFTGPSGIRESTPSMTAPIYQQQYQYYQQQPQQQQQQPPQQYHQQQYRAPSYDIYQQPQQQQHQQQPPQQQYPPHAQYQSQAPLSQNQYQQPPQAVSHYQQQPPQQQPAWAHQQQQPQQQQQQPQQQYQQPPWVQQPQQNQQYQQPQYQSPLNQYNQAPIHHQAQQQHQQPQQQPQQQYNNQFVSQSNQQQFNSYSQPQQQQHTVSHDQVDQHAKLAQDQRGISPGIITLRKEAPITQKPAPVYSSQPAAISFRESSTDVDSLGGANMRGDLKWPPPEYKEAAAVENDERRKLASGPVCRPRKVKRDYTEFFAKNALSHHYPSYKVPPGTQHMTY